MKDYKLGKQAYDSLVLCTGSSASVWDLNKQKFSFTRSLQFPVKVYYRKISLRPKCILKYLFISSNHNKIIGKPQTS